jgi:hypothetical protein
MRYSGDDYCYGAVLTTRGFWNAQTYSYLNQVPFHGNRFTLTLFSSIAGLFRPSFSGVLPGLAIVLWVTGIFATIKLLVKNLRGHLQNLEILLFSEFLVFITLYAAPDLPESLYWRSGMLPYLAPLIMNLFLIGLISKYRSQGHLSNYSLIAIALFAIIAAGFSETAAAMQLGYIIFWLTSLIAQRNGERDHIKRNLKPIISAGVGTSISILMLIYSPSIQSELMDTMQSPKLLESLSLSAKASWDFIVGSGADLPLPHFVVLFFFTGFSILFSTRKQQDNIELASMVPTKGALILLATFGLIFFGMVPSVFIRSVIPNPRALIASRFVVVIAFAALGWLIGTSIYYYIKHQTRLLSLTRLGILVLFIPLWTYPIRAAYNTIPNVVHFEKWATLWDLRDENIRTEKLRGVQDIEVMHLDKVIFWVAELAPDPDTWYNICAANYYGVESIKANLPGWDE